MGLDDAAAERVGEGAEGDIDLPDQLDASYAEPHRSSKLMPWLVRGAAAAAVLAVCVTLVKLYSSGDEASVPEPQAPVEPGPRTAQGDGGLTLPNGGAPNANPETVADDGSAAVQRTTLPGGRPADPVFDPALEGETTADAAQRTIRESQGDESVAADVGGEVPLDENGRPLVTPDPTGAGLGVRDPFETVALDEPGSATQGSGTDASAGADESATGPVVVSGDLAGAEDPQDAQEGGLRYASAGDLAGLWDGNAIPMEAVDGGVRVVTPNVGRVRAVMLSGEVFEGRMYAVGRRQDLDRQRPGAHGVRERRRREGRARALERERRPAWASRARRSTPACRACARRRRAGCSSAA